MEVDVLERASVDGKYAEIDHLAFMSVWFGPDTPGR